jgi:UDP-glucose 4-epimerase
MHVAVVGGAGFIGSRLVEQLVVDEHRVDVIDDLTAGSLVALSEARVSASSGQLSIHTMTVDGDSAEDLGVLLERRAIDRVVHLAPSALDIVITASAGAGVGKIVATEPSERFAAARKRGLDYTVLRLGEVVGAGARSGVVAHLLSERTDAAPAGADVVFLADAVDAFERALERGGGLVLDVSSGVVTSTADIAAILGVPRAPVTGDPVTPGDPSRAELYLGWKPTTPLDRLRRLVS